MSSTALQEAATSGGPFPGGMQLDALSIVDNRRAAWRLDDQRQTHQDHGERGPEERANYFSRRENAETEAIAPSPMRA